MVIKNRFCLIALFIIPLLLAGYFVSQVEHLQQSMVYINGTINSFQGKGHHDNARKEFTMTGYPAVFVHYNQGFHSLFVKNLEQEIYDPAEVVYTTYLPRRLKPASQRQVSFYIRGQDLSKLKKNGEMLPYFGLVHSPEKLSPTSYYIDLYTFIYREAHGLLLTFVSLLLFMASTIGASFWGEKYKALLVYIIAVIVLHVILIMF